jgi:hypothetical protein
VSLFGLYLYLYLAVQVKIGVVQFPQTLQMIVAGILSIAMNPVHENDKWLYQRSDLNKSRFFTQNCYTKVQVFFS